MKKIILFGILIAMLTSCSHTSYTSGSKNGNVYKVSNAVATSQSVTKNDIVPVKAPMTVGPVTGIPNATAFRMSGDYANNIGISLDSQGNITYFPDPQDITADSEPIELGGGWWLNRQGLGQHSVFTTYTFAEYASLPAVPTVEQLKNSIIPGAKVTDFIELPVKLNDSMSNLTFIKEYLNGR